MHYITATLFWLVALGPPVALAECRRAKLELPVTMEGLRPLIPVTIDGRATSLIVDTGAFWSLLTPAAAARFELKRTSSLPPGLVVSGVNGAADVALVDVPAFGVNNVTLGHMEFLLGSGDLGAESSGFIGRNILRQFDLEFDLANGTLRFWKFKGCGSEPLVYWADQNVIYNVIPIEPTNGSLGPVISTVVVNGHRLRALIDTGFSTSYVTLGGARKAGIHRTDPGVIEAGTIAGIARKWLKTWIAPIQSFEIGGEKVMNTRLRIGESESAEGVDMFIGDDFFLSNRVLISFTQNKMYFTYNGGKIFNLKPTSDLDGGTPLGAVASKAAVAVLTADPTDADGFARRGSALLERGDVDQALSDFDHAIAINPKNARYFYKRAEARQRKRQMFLAMDDLNTALKLVPGDPQILLLRAGFKLSGQDRRGAREDVDAAAEAAPEQADLRQQIGQFYDALDEPKLAITQFGLYIKYHKQDASLPMVLNGRCWARALANMELDSGLVDCDAAVRATNKGAQALDSRGLIHLRRGEYDRAIADYDAALAKRPDMGWSLYGRGIAKLKSGDKAGGEIDLAAAAKVAPKLAERAKGYGIVP